MKCVKKLRQEKRKQAESDEKCDEKNRAHETY